MELWKTTLKVNSRSVTQVNIKCGIYEGDSLSPLLFCIGLNSLNQIITKSGYGYRFSSRATISHLLYMDDIKLSAKNEQDIDSLIHLTRIYNEDIGMLFGLEECGWMVARRGKVIKTDGLEVSASHILRHTDQLQVPWYPTVAREP